MKNHLSLILVEYGWIQPTTLRPILVDCTSFTVVKDASARQIPEVMAPVPLEDERILVETQLLDSGYVRITQWHPGIHATLGAAVMKTHAVHCL